MKKQFSIKIILLSFLCIVMLLVSAINLSVVNSYAAESSSDAIENIYDETIGKFYFDYLNQIASKANYADVNAMITAAERGEIKTSQDFGETRVKFGKDARDNSELEWFPTYLSNSDEGPVLTLWLTNSEENCRWADGYNKENSTNPPSNIYSTSYMRSVNLNNSGYYYHYFRSTGSIAPTKIDYVATSDGTNKFEMYTTGALGKYIIAPSAVGWQATQNRLKNDPEHTEFTNYDDYKLWLNDKLWLPGIYEIYDVNVKENVLENTFYANGGLWNTSKSLRSNKIYSWIRTGYSYDSYTVKYLDINGMCSNSQDYADSAWAVRPALHLNLKKAVENAVYKHEHVWESSNEDGWVETTPATCVAQGEEERVCTAAGCTLTSGKETRKTAIDPTAHDFTGAPWKSDGTNHWHECTLCGAKDTLVAHTTGAAATCDTDQICTICSAVLTPKLGHNWDTKWTNDSSGHWHKCLRAGCTEKQDDAAHNPDRVAADCEHAQVCTVCSFEMAAKLGHNYVDTITDPTCEADGYTTHTCSRCSDSYVDTTVPKTGHSWGAPVWQWAGNYLTCKAKFTCSTCNKEQTETCAVSHSSATASCTVAGDTTHTASVTFDGKPYSDSQVESGTTLPHDWQLLSQTVAPDCENAGAGDFECSVCHKTETRPIDKLGHDPVDDAEVPATCETDGRAAGKHCSRCNKTLEGLTVINALGHDWGAWVETKPATYTADGEERRECQRSGCTHFETRVIPMKVKVAITVTINPASSEVGAALETLTATVTAGTLIDPADVPYTLSTDADINTMGTYTITGTCTDDRYDITFVESVYIVSKKADDPNGGGEIDLPIDAELKFSVSQSETKNEYPAEDNCIKRGYWAQLWEQTPDGDREFTGKLIGDDGKEKSCILTLTVPNEIITAILNGGQIDLNKITENLGLSYVSEYAEENGAKVPKELTAVDNFKLIKDGDKYSVKFTYSGDFGAEIVFSALNAEEPAPAKDTAGIPWWVWLIVGLAGAAVIGVVIVIIVVAKKKSAAAVVADNGEVLGRLDKQDEKLNEIREIVDGGFNDIVDDE